MRTPATHAFVPHGKRGGGALLRNEKLINTLGIEPIDTQKKSRAHTIMFARQAGAELRDVWVLTSLPSLASPSSFYDF